MPPLPPSRAPTSCVSNVGLEYVDTRPLHHLGITVQVSTPFCPVTSLTFQGWQGAPVQCGFAGGFCNPFDQPNFGANYYDSGITPWGFWIGFGGDHVSPACPNDGDHALTAPPQWFCDPLTGPRANPTGTCCRCSFVGVPVGSYTYDYASRTCLLVPCAPGTRWCEELQQCVTATARCADALHCQWNPNTCNFDCDAATCPDGSFFDFSTCACIPCPPGTCVCKGDHCIQCQDPRCKSQLHCTWDSSACKWACDDYKTICGPGIHWDWDFCKCVPNCPVGQQWCDVSAACIDATHACAAELHCVWDTAACAWNCDDPATRCVAPSAWDPIACRCTGPGAPYAIFDTQGRHHWAFEDDAGIQYRRAPFAADPADMAVLVTGSVVGDRDPKHLRNWRGQHVICYQSAADVVRRASNDQGRTWNAAETMITGGKHPMPLILPKNGSELLAAFVPVGGGGNGEIHARIKAPGGLAWSDEYTFVLADGTPVQVIDDAFGLAADPSNLGRILLTAKKPGGTGINRWFSTDPDASTWTDLGP